MNLRPFYNFAITESKKVQRSDDDDIINLRLKDAEGSEYFLKEVQEHSLRAGLDDVYTFLSKVKIQHSKLILPILRQDNRSTFIFQIEDKSFLLFPFEVYEPFSTETMSLTTLWESLDEFHAQLVTGIFEKQSYRTYRGWFEQGSLRLKKKYGDDLPFLKSIDNFFENRFDKISFKTGPIHWDIHPENLGHSPDGRILLLDFDLVQEGAYAHDFIAAAAMCVDWDHPAEVLTESFLQQLHEKIKPYAEGLFSIDLIFLLARYNLGDLAVEKSRARVIDQLKKCEILLATATP